MIVNVFFEFVHSYMIKANFVYHFGNFFPILTSSHTCIVWEPPKQLQTNFILIDFSYRKEKKSILQKLDELEILTGETCRGLQTYQGSLTKQYCQWPTAFSYGIVKFASNLLKVFEIVSKSTEKNEFSVWSFFNVYIELRVKMSRLFLR